MAYTFEHYDSFVAFATDSPPNHPPPPTILLVHGTFIDAPTPHELRIRRGYVCGVDVLGGGRICYFERATEGKGFREAERIVRTLIVREEGEEVVEIVKMSFTRPGQAVAVGVIDCHIHAPQFPQLHTRTTVPLLTWLNEYTFPLESQFSDPLYAEKTYSLLIRRLLKNATTTGVYFSSRHLEATKTLASAAAIYGQRALIGKVCSDQLVPEYYAESVEEAVGGTVEFIQWCYARFGSGREALVRPVVTPRFVPTCSVELLKGLGEVVGKFPGVHVQTHAAESVDEVLLVAELHPDTPRDIAILKNTNLLTENTILAHCTHLSDSEAHQLVDLDVGIVSCPYSNMLFARSVVPIPRYYHLNDPNPDNSLTNRKVGTGSNDGTGGKINMRKIGLGTDISGGPSASLWVNMRLAILQDRVQSYKSMANYPPPPPPPPAESQQSILTPTATDDGPDEASWQMTHTYAYHIATVGGAATIGMADLLGTWEVGKLFDGFLVDLGSGEEGGGEKEEEEAVEEMEEDEERIRDGWERFVMGGDDRDIRIVWVAGSEVVRRK